MASKESTGLQAALIVFVLITVGLGIWVFLAQSQVTKLKDEIKTEKATTQATTTRANFRDQQVKFLLHTTGFAELEDSGVGEAFGEMERIAGADQGRFGEDFATMTAVKTAFEQEVGPTLAVNVGGPTDGDYKHWRSIPHYYKGLTQKKGELAEKTVQQEKQDNADQKSKFDANVRRLEAEVDTHKDASTQLAKVEADARATASDYQTKFKEVEQLAKNKDNKYSADTIALTQQIKDRNARIQTVENLNKGLVERAKRLQRPDFDQPDGQVTWVNQRSRTVWINLGLADGLYRQTTFSVYDKEQGSFARGQSDARLPDDDPQSQAGFDIENYAKAQIEVTRIIDRNLAEARIVSDDVSNPILPGDEIFTPAWTPGQTVKFALAGFMDYNGDGKSDREMIKNLISVSGGEVVAEVTDNGDYVGAVSLDTRYLILGERPTDKSADKFRSNYGKILGHADDYGIEKIEFKKFMGFMGFKAEVRTVPLGGGNESFQLRRPSRGESGAY